MASQESMFMKNSESKRLAELMQINELEREEFVLHKMLGHEQKVCDHLIWLQHQPDGYSLLGIPASMHPKMKALMVELAIVELEIAQVESQLNKLGCHGTHEKESNVEFKYREWKHGSSPSPSKTSQWLAKNLCFDMKAMYLLCKALKGDHMLIDFRMRGKSLCVRKNPTHKENSIDDRRVWSFGEIFKRKGIPKPTDPQVSTIVVNGGSIVPVSPSQVVPIPSHCHKKNTNKWSLNKLSERIMQCLILVFVRLLRTSRTMESKKSGPVAQSSYFFCFGVDMSSNMQSDIIFKNDSRQQDPYRIFGMQESVQRDIGPYKNLVRFTSTSLNVKCIKKSNTVALFKKLKDMFDALEKEDIRFLSHEQKLAFWINMYNACIMNGFLRFGVPPSSNPERLWSMIDKATLNIAGNVMNAGVIARFLLRKPASSLVGKIAGNKYGKELIVHKLYGLETPDPNVIFALCCGTGSSPAVKVYTAECVISQLESSKLQYLQAAIVVMSTKRIGIPELLLWSMDDFANNVDSLMDWVCQQLRTSSSLRKSIMECRRSGRGRRCTMVEKIKHDFEFQYLL